jgi:hypothetical protein
MRAALGRDDLDALERCGAECEAIDRAIALVGTVHGEARPAAQMFQFGKESIEDEGIEALVERTSDLYGELAATVETLSRLLGGAGERKADRDAALR